jgi:hypothetical protein
MMETSACTAFGCAGSLVGFFAFICLSFDALG